jgi:hypothetical protein
MSTPRRRRRGRFARTLLAGPDAVARAAAAGARRPEEVWLLRQPRRVRVSYARAVLDAGGDQTEEEIWMLRQPAAVRESYIREVLKAGR